MALGLLALMLHAEARRRARRDAHNEYVPLAEQDPALWDAQMIDEAEAILLRASALGAIGCYQLEAALQSAHVHRRRTGNANWAEVVQLYDALLTLSGSPVVAINRSLALAEMRGASAGLEALQEVAADARLTQYQPYWAARAELLAKTGAQAKPARRTKSQSVSSATPQSAASCNAVNPNRRTSAAICLRCREASRDRADRLLFCPAS